MIFVFIFLKASSLPSFYFDSILSMLLQNHNSKKIVFSSVWILSGIHFHIRSIILYNISAQMSMLLTKSFLILKTFSKFWNASFYIPFFFFLSRSHISRYFILCTILTSLIRCTFLEILLLLPTINPVFFLQQMFKNIMRVISCQLQLSRSAKTNIDGIYS